MLFRSLLSAVPIAESNLWNTTTWFSMFNWQIVAGLWAWGISTLLWIIVLNKTELTYAYYVASLNYLILPILGRWLFEERLNWIRLVGMGLILLGVGVTIYGKSVQK